MKLAELNPHFLKMISLTAWKVVRDINEADGVQFLCPVCFKNNGGEKGTHTMICWTPKVPAEAEPGPGRWNFLGTGLEDLELKNGSSSVQLNGGCNAHFWIRGGEIIIC